MKSKLTQLGIGVLVLSALAFKAYDYRMESNKESAVADWTWAKDYTLRLESKCCILQVPIWAL